MIIKSSKKSEVQAALATLKINKIYSIKEIVDTIKQVCNHQTDTTNSLKMVSGNYSGMNTILLDELYVDMTYQRRIRFSKVPYDESRGVGAAITIYTLTGEKVYSWNVVDNLGTEPGDDGYNTWWDLRSINNQEVAPGLYLYTVEFEGQSSVGKFAIVR